MPENNPLGYLMQNPEGNNQGAFNFPAQGNVSLFDSVVADLPEFGGFLKLQETFANLNKQLQDRQAQMQQQVQDRQQQIADMLQTPEGTTAQQPTGGGRTQQPRPSNIPQQPQLNELTSGTEAAVRYLQNNPQPGSPYQQDNSNLAIGPGSPPQQPTLGFPTNFNPGTPKDIGQILGGGAPTGGVAQPVPQPTMQNTSESTSKADRVNTQIPGINLLLRGGR